VRELGGFKNSTNKTGDRPAGKTRFASNMAIKPCVLHRTQTKYENKTPTVFVGYLAQLPYQATL